jgi:hypothetical protein
MRFTFSIILLAAIFIGCKKDKFTTAPQISYKKISPNVYQSGIQSLPKIIIGITDAEGDIGFNDGTDTCKFYIKNLLTGKLDSSLFLPDLTRIQSKKFEAEVEIELDESYSPLLLQGSNRPRPKTDTVFYEIYTRDFAKNKSNVIKTGDPLFIKTP